MNFSRRDFTICAGFLLGPLLVEMLASSIWKVPSAPTLRATAIPASESGIPVTFVDVAQEAGLTTPNVWGGLTENKYIIEAKGSGVAYFDYDNDGWLDVYTTNGIRFEEAYTQETSPHSHLYRNNRDGTFTDVTDEAGIRRTGWGTGVCVGDYDNDGWDDLFCTYWGQNILWRNNGNGTFTDVTHKARVHGERVRWGTGCTFLDYDRDGFLDLFVANYLDLDISKVPAPGQTANCQWKGMPVLCGPPGLPAGENILYHNNGDGTFTVVPEKAGISKPGRRYSISAVSYDFDNDGWPDIYVAVDTMASIMYRNSHDGTFTDTALVAGCAYTEDGREMAGMGLAVGDYNFDGWLDIFKTHFQTQTPTLYRSNGDGTFDDATRASGLGDNTKFVCWGTGFIDYDNDGLPDLFIVTGHVYPEVDRHGMGDTYKSPRLVYRNRGGGKFTNVSDQMGDAIRARYSSRGCAFGDFDNDGDTDVLVLNKNEPPSLLRNDGGNKNNWISIKLRGTLCNRMAIGARVRVVAGGHAQIDEVHSGGSVMSQSDMRLHFGLGHAKTIDLIEVTWPATRKVEKFTDVEANQFVTVKEGAGVIKAEKRQR